MIIEIGLILTVVSLGLVCYCAAKPRQTYAFVLPVLGLICSMLGLAALLQDAEISGDPWALTIVFILNSGLAMFSIGQLIERV